MPFWRKRNEDFEWRDYVRTTILLRRKERRKRLEDVKAAAVFGVRQAGRSGAHAAADGAASLAAGAASGLSRFGRFSGRIAHAAGLGALSGARWSAAGLGRLSRRAGEASAAGFRRAGQASAAGLRRGAGAVGPIASRGGRATAAALAPIEHWLGDARVRLPIILVAAACALSAIHAAATRGLDTTALIAGAIALATLFLLLLPTMIAALAGRSDPGALSRVANGLVLVPGLDRMTPGGALATTAAVLLALAGGGVWLATRSSDSTPRPVAVATPVETATVHVREPSAAELKGRAVALTGDRLRIRGRTFALSGIEAPEANQSCERANGDRWRCGSAAKDALARSVRGRTVSCEILETDADGTLRGTCATGSGDVAAGLVSNGNVFAERGIFARYSSAEGEAQDKKAGLWDGNSERPADYRARRWDEAKRAAPDGCPIKGRVSSGARVYVMPWASSYDGVRVSTSRGERWFCSEAEAEAAGWRRSAPS